jgi:Flp pilus assembly pilin Flp
MRFITELRRGREDRGAAAVETAFLVTLVLVPLLIGLTEFGFAFNEWQTVAAASREGARVASAAGPLESPPAAKDADCLALEATAGALTSLSDGSAVSEVWIFKANPNGQPTQRNRYRPKVDTDAPGSIFCTNWVRVGGMGYPISSRDNSGTNRDHIGVRVIFDHDWTTNLPPFTGTVQWNNQTVMRVEPESDL